MTHASLFSGIGGFDLAAEWMGWNNVFHCEINNWCSKVLQYHFPKSIHYADITKTDFRQWCGKIDILTGGFPCQPFSLAGQRKGKDDDRYLWPEMLRVIREIRPTWVIGENVGGIVSMVQPGQEIEVAYQSSLFEANNQETILEQEFVIESICRDLEREEYTVQPILIPACAVGAPHRRDRVWFIAHAIGLQSERNGESRKLGSAKGKSESNRQKREWVRDAFGNICQEIYASDSESFGHEYAGKSRKRRERFENNYSRHYYRWEQFPTKSPICSRNDGLYSKLYNRTFSNENSMDRNIVIKMALDAGRLIVDKDTGTIYSTRQIGKEGELIKLFGSDCNGYIVHTIMFNGIKKQCRAHQIVWISENGLYDKDNFMIDHINRNRKDNRLCNLRLVDAKSNRENSTPYISKLSQYQKDMIYFLNKDSNMSCREIAEDFGISKSRLHQIIKGHEGLDGISFSKWRSESIKAYGNAIVPQVAYEIFKAIEKVNDRS